MLERKDFSNEFDALVSRALAGFPLMSEFQLPGVGAIAAPAMDVYEKDGKYMLDLSVPGYDPNDISIEVNGSTVTISGMRRDSEEKKGARFYRREVRTGSFTRSVTLPQDLDADQVEATINKGVLTIALAPTKPIAPKKIAIKGE